MKVRKLRKGVIVGAYILVITMLLTSMYITGKMVLDEDKGEIEQPVNNPVIEEHIPVVNDKIKVMRPYIDQEIKVLKNYYDYKANEDTQKQSIIYYDNTYIQSSGICYGGKDNFEVISVLAGKVINVKEDKLLGKIIEIEHDKEIISIYQSLSEVMVKKDDQVTQGQTIGKSGVSNINKELSSHVNFELIKSGKVINPEEYFDKDINEM